MPVPLADLDLNLLKVFDVLMEERSVSRAARRLGITQSSTSNALERLRRALDDRVLERSGNAMVPTRTAIELWPHVQLALAQIVTGINSVGEFDPATLRQTVSIGMDEYSLAILGPPIEARLRAAAPRIRLVFLSATPHEDEQALFGGRLDLLIGPAWRPIAGLDRSVLLHETFVAVVDADHPLVGERGTATLKIEDYVRYPHILVSRRGYVTGNVDDGMRQLGMRRTIATTTPYYASAPRFLRGTELILNLGRRLAREFAEGVGLRTFEIPMKVPGFDICLFWHPRNTRAKPHQWLRREIEAVAADVQAVT
jgi:DNA-binding transcriptional LysR family regulator